MWIENKNVAISDRFICFILMVKRRWRPVFWGRQLKKINFFEEKSASGWPGRRIFWPQNNLATLLRWRRHWKKSIITVVSDVWLNTGCEAPPSVPHGDVTWSSSDVNSTANYSCHVGYELRGASQLVCHINSSWFSDSVTSHRPPSCSSKYVNVELRTFWRVCLLFRGSMSLS